MPMPSELLLQVQDQTSLSTEIQTIKGKDHVVHLVVKNAPFTLLVGAKDNRSLAAYSFSAELIYDGFDFMKKVQYIANPPLTCSIERVSDQAVQLVCKVSVLTSQHEQSNFRVLVTATCDESKSKSKSQSKSNAKRESARKRKRDNATSSTTDTSESESAHVLQVTSAAIKMISKPEHSKKKASGKAAKPARKRKTVKDLMLESVLRVEQNQKRILEKALSLIQGGGSGMVGANGSGMVGANGDFSRPPSRLEREHKAAEMLGHLQQTGAALHPLQQQARGLESLLRTSGEALGLSTSATTQPDQDAGGSSSANTDPNSKNRGTSTNTNTNTNGNMSANPEKNKGPDLLVMFGEVLNAFSDVTEDQATASMGHVLGAMDSQNLMAAIEMCELFWAHGLSNLTERKVTPSHFMLGGDGCMCRPCPYAQQLQAAESFYQGIFQ